MASGRFVPCCRARASGRQDQVEAMLVAEIDQLIASGDETIRDDPLRQLVGRRDRARQPCLDQWAR
jgi:hypothetical protein